MVPNHRLFKEQLPGPPCIEGEAWERVLARERWEEMSVPGPLRATPPLLHGPLCSVPLGGRMMKLAGPAPITGFSSDGRAWVPPAHGLPVQPCGR